MMASDISAEHVTTASFSGLNEMPVTGNEWTPFSETTFRSVDDSKTEMVESQHPTDTKRPQWLEVSVVSLLGPTSSARIHSNSKPSLLLSSPFSDELMLHLTIRFPEPPLPRRAFELIIAKRNTSLVFPFPGTRTKRHARAAESAGSFSSLSGLIFGATFASLLD